MDRYYAGWAGKVAGETIDVSPKTKMVYTTLDPIGVCGQVILYSSTLLQSELTPSFLRDLVIPWNYPIMMWAWKVGPALAA